MRRLHPTSSSLWLASVSLATLFAASAAYAAPPPGAPAATPPASAPPSGGQNVVVVTAERREQRLLEVPATVTAIGASAIQAQGLTTMKSIVEQVPNAVLPDDPENFETYINIRGIHQADINAEPNFGLYRNGIFVGGERANLGARSEEH